MREYDKRDALYRRFKRSGHISEEAVRARRSVEEAIPASYRARLPTYLLARCPICSAEVTEAVDTFSLNGLGWWREEPQGFGWYGLVAQPGGPPAHKTQPSYQADCAHIQALTYGVNLNDIVPDDVRHRHNLVIGSERPGLLKSFMEQAGSCAVIHTLPVGRLDDDDWQPRYTAYFVSYFSEDADAYPRSLAPQTPEDSDFCWPYDALDYELDAWVETGKLQWLGEE